MTEHGVGYTPYGDHVIMQCGMEVILADGTVVQTGMGALPGSQTNHLYKYGFGPSVDGLFTQSNFGVVTKIGMWLMPEPPGYRPYMVTFEKESDLHAITEVLRPLKVNMLIPAVAMTVEMLWEASVQITRRDYYTGKGPIPDSVRKKICGDLRIGAWNFYGALYGPPPMMDNTWEVIHDAFASIPGAKFYFDEDRSKDDVAWQYRKKLGSGIPNMTEYNVMNWIPNGAHMDFSPISPVTGVDATRQYELIRDRCNNAGFDYCGEFAVGWRDMHHIFCLTFDRNDPKEKTRANKLFGDLVDAAAAAGYGEYRTHLDFMDQIAGTYNWNDSALLRMHEKVKDVVDPSGILSPGKWASGQNPCVRGMRNEGTGYERYFFWTVRAGIRVDVGNSDVWHRRHGWDGACGICCNSKLGCAGKGCEAVYQELHHVSRAWHGESWYSSTELSVWQGQGCA